MRAPWGRPSSRQPLRCSPKTRSARRARDARRRIHGARRGQHARRQSRDQGNTTAWRGQEDRARYRLVRRLARQRSARHPQARRAGRLADRCRPALGRRGPGGQGLCQDAAQRDFRQRHIGGAGHHNQGSGTQLLPLHTPTAPSGWRGSAPMPSTRRATRRW